VAVELNPDAHMYCLENVRLNKLGDRVRAVLGDVREVCPTFSERFDRVLMPLPKGAYEFLDTAIPLVKPGGVLHFYHWASRDDPFSEGERLLASAADEYGRSLEILERVRVSQYSPSAWKVRIDARVG
jgi:tRNA (guanine37-N1)-methyltransferase